MALKGKMPDEVQKRLKCLMYGPAGVGKTTASIQFPAPYLIDTERGAENPQYVRALRDAGGAYFFTTDPEELIAEVRELVSTPHEYRTLVIDPLTVIYNDLLDKAAEEVGTDFGKHKGPADRVIKRLLTLLLRLDMNVIITSHAKPRWARTKDAKGKDTVVEDGSTFDCYSRLDYLFDLVLELGKRGRERIATVRKTRIESFADGEVFAFSYSAIAEKYGADTMERVATPETLATPEQVAALSGLVTLLRIDEEQVGKWLAKAKCESFDEMSSTMIGKWIDWCQERIKTMSGAAAGATA